VDRARRFPTVTRNRGCHASILKKSKDAPVSVAYHESAVSPLHERELPLSDLTNIDKIFE